jgi:small subunit ribosomal protein S17
MKRSERVKSKLPLDGNGQIKVGRVVSDKMEKTVVVAVDYLRPHPLYKKIVRRTSKFYAHDEHNVAKIGDTVRIKETRPLSKLKRWIVLEIVQTAEGGA